MQEPITTESEKLPKFKVSIALLNGYYLSFLAIGLLVVILKVDASTDLKQALFFILLFLITGSFSLLKSAVDIEAQEEANKQDPQTVIYGGYYSTINNRSGDEVYNTTNKNFTDIMMGTPSNYFDVIKTIELVPDSPNPALPGIKDLLVKLQSYVEADSSLVLSDKEKIFELIKKTAVEAKSDPINNDLESVVVSLQQIDQNSDFKSRMVQALKAGAMQELDLQLSSPATKIVMAAIKEWRKEVN